MTDRTRFTISVEPGVYEAFADLAHSSGVSLSRCIGDWLRDTSEAAQLTTLKVKAVRKSAEEAFRLYQVAVAEEMPEMIDRLKATSWGVAREHLGFDEKDWGREAGRPAGPELRRVRGSSGLAQPGARPAAPAKPVPPSSNTGGKSPGKTRRAA